MFISVFDEALGYGKLVAEEIARRTQRLDFQWTYVYDEWKVRDDIAYHEATSWRKVTDDHPNCVAVDLGDLGNYFKVVFVAKVE